MIGRGAISALALAFLAFASKAPLHAEVELVPNLGGIFGGAVSTRQGDLTLDPGLALGLMVAWRVRHDGMIEIAYSRQDTVIELESRPLFDATLDYLQAGGVWEIRDYGPMRPFIGLAFGASRLAVDPSSIDEEWFFSAGLYGGVKHWMGDRFGIRVEGRGLLHSTGSGGAFLCGSVGGSGACAVELEGSGFLQVQATIGLMIRLH